MARLKNGAAALEDTRALIEDVNRQIEDQRRRRADELSGAADGNALDKFDAEIKRLEILAGRHRARIKLLEVAAAEAAAGKIQQGPARRDVLDQRIHGERSIQHLGGTVDLLAGRGP